jgi:hypothetical protein
MNTDMITVLRTYGPRLAKLICSDGNITSYDEPRHFDLFEMPIDDLAGLARLLRVLMRRVDCCVVRGAIADPARTKRVRRLLYADHKTGALPTLTEWARRWIALDVDAVPRPEHMAAGDLAACAQEAVQYIPAGFQNAACIVQATASHGVKQGCRLRLWYWLDRPITGQEAKRWLRTAPVDRAVFGAAQIIYTAAPLFIGCADHLPIRMLQMAGDTVRTPSPEASAPPPTPSARVLTPPTSTPRYVAAAMRNAIARITSAQVGNRHAALLSEARALARFVEGGMLAEGDLRHLIAGAAAMAGKEDAAEITSICNWALSRAAMGDAVR